MLSFSMALTMNPDPFSSIEATFENTYLRDLYDMRIYVGSANTSVFTNNMGKVDQSMDEFFSLRIERCVDLVAWDLTMNGTHGDLDGLAEWGQNKDGDGLRSRGPWPPTCGTCPYCSAFIPGLSWT